MCLEREREELLHVYEHTSHPSNTKDSTPLYRFAADSTTLLNCGPMHRGTGDLSDIMSHLLGLPYKMNSFHPDEMRYCLQTEK